jgi:putative Mg2+ transporter-C (MgtC) family protein
MFGSGQALRVLGVQIAMCLLCGAMVGFERQLRGKPAGIRTSTLVCLGTMIFVRLGLTFDTNLAGGDPTRVLGQVVTGVGFLGAGVILSRDGLVKGVTSAAVIWVLAGVGSAIGMQLYLEAFLVSLVVVGVLVGVELLERAFKSLRRGVHAAPDETGTEQPYKGEGSQGT